MGLDGAILEAVLHSQNKLSLGKILHQAMMWNRIDVARHALQVHNIDDHTVGPRNASPLFSTRKTAFCFLFFFFLFFSSVFLFSLSICIGDPYYLLILCIYFVSSHPPENKRATMSLVKILCQP